MVQGQCAAKAEHLLLTESEARLVPPGCEPHVKEHGSELQVTGVGSESEVCVLGALQLNMQ